MNVRFFILATRAEFDALSTKNPLGVYWIEETQELYKGDILFGTGAYASESAAGLLSKEDYAEFKSLIHNVQTTDLFNVVNKHTEDINTL